MQLLLRLTVACLVFGHLALTTPILTATSNSSENPLPPTFELLVLQGLTALSPFRRPGPICRVTAESATSSGTFQAFLFTKVTIFAYDGNDRSQLISITNDRANPTSWGMVSRFRPPMDLGQPWNWLPDQMSLSDALFLIREHEFIGPWVVLREFVPSIDPIDGGPAREMFICVAQHLQPSTASVRWVLVGSISKRVTSKILRTADITQFPWTSNTTRTTVV